MNGIEVCYCGNAKAFPQILLSAMSMAEHCGRAIKVRLVTADLTDLDERFVPIDERMCAVLREALKDRNADSDTVIVDVEAQYRASLSGGKNEKGHYTPYAQFRLLFDLVDDMPEKVIYLDTDTMFVGDISPMWDVDVEGVEFAAVKDVVLSKMLKPSYFNSGVMILNLKRCRETGLLAKCRKMVKNRKMIMPDQTALNKYATAKLLLPRRFNEQRDIREDTVIKHLCRRIKRYGLLLRIDNFKQTDRDAVHNKMKTHAFDVIFARYDELAEKYPEIIK